MLRAVLHEGGIAFVGTYYRANANVGWAPQTPVLTAALGPTAFALAGELADGALAWLCPIDYLHNVAAPAVVRGAEQAGRPPPPLIAHVPVVIGNDRARARELAHQSLDYFASVPVYARMFAAAGYPPSPGGRLTDELLDALVVSGEPSELAMQLLALVDRGIDEVMVTLVPGRDQTRQEDELLELLASMG
jgi:alkanesulfonate monooxygenase SsuD/methylene tetrahydromethanopterin reductase-like flavin-dependent oxidoreductase (luciferase family)